jgi:hypothetical protein
MIPSGTFHAHCVLDSILSIADWYCSSLEVEGILAGNLLVRPLHGIISLIPDGAGNLSSTQVVVCQQAQLPQPLRFKSSVCLELPLQRKVLYKSL